MYGMAADRHTEALTLRAPERKDWEQKDGHHFVFVSEDRKRKFVAYDDKLVEAFTAAALAGIEHEYVWIPSKRDPVIIEIPGVFTKPDKPRGSSRMYSDEQFRQLMRSKALDVAGVTSNDPAIILEAADFFAAWITETPRLIPAPAASPNGTRVPADELTRKDLVESARAEMRALFKDDEDSARLFLTGRFGLGWRWEKIGETDLLRLIEQLEEMRRAPKA